MIKKLAIFAGVAVFSLVWIANAIGGNAYDADTKGDFETIFDIQRDACLANETIYESFEWNNTYIYPDDFAGTYIDYDMLHVMVTSKDALKRYQTMLNDYTCLKFDIVEHSYNELMENAARTVEELGDKVKITSYGVALSDNKPFIRVIYYDYDKVNILLKGSEDIIIEKADDYVKKETTVYGGAHIFSNDHHLTLAGSGTYAGNYAFLTCGHDMATGASVSAGGSTIGNFSTVKYTNYDYGDYGIILAGSGYSSSSRVYTSGGSISLNGVMTNPTEGTYLYKYGQVSGQAYCKVTRTGVNVLSDGSMHIYGLTEAELISGATDSGDSGGPYRAGTYFCGVHHGSSTSDNTTYVFFTPYTYPMHAGFTERTF